MLEQDVTEQQYKLKYIELKEAYWQAQFEIDEQYDFGMVVLDCK